MLVEVWSAHDHFVPLTTRVSLRVFCLRISSRLVLNSLRKEDLEGISTLEEKQGSPKELGSLENSL